MTSQYAGLQQLHEKYKDQGFAVIGFPCNQFGGQEPGSIEEIQAFAEKDYGVTFEIYRKIDVNGQQAHSLFEFLKSQCPGILGTEGVKWNFTKFLCDVNGTPMKRYSPTTKPEALEEDIEELLEYKEIDKIPKQRTSIFSFFGF
jgi:glutathione peroxidase